MEGSVVRPCRDGFPGRLRGSRSWLHARGRTTFAQRMANPHDRAGRQSRGSSDGLPRRRRVLEAWRSLGGLETLHSYGVDVGPAMAGRDFRGVQAAFAARFPEHHRHFLETLKVSTAIGDYFFCHAGVRPGVPLDRQDRDDLLNIRDPFLFSEAEHGKLVVHGHTPSVAPEIRPNRIGIDTAAYATNRLTCLVLEKDQRRFLHVGDSDVQRGNQ